MVNKILSFLVLVVLTATLTIPAVNAHTEKTMTIFMGIGNVPVGSTYHCFPNNIQSDLLSNTCGSSNSVWTRAFVPKSGTLKNLWAKLDGAIGPTETLTLTVYVDNSATALTVSFANTGAGAETSDTANTGSVSAGEYVTMRLIGTAITTGGNIVAWGFELEGASDTSLPVGFAYTFDTTTTETDPTSGKLQFDSGTFASITELYISETDRHANNIAAVLATWDDSTSTVKGTLTLIKENAPSNLRVFHVTGSRLDNGAWDTFTVTPITSTGSFLDDDPVNILFTPSGDKGDDGDTGATGAAGADGHSALVTTTTEAPGANCATGGQKVDSGTDDGTGAGDPDDGLLHVDEITDTGYACNGATGATGSAGADGFNTLQTITAEPPGVNCQPGGVLVRSGLDNGDGAGDPADNVLHLDEVDASGYICTGEQGATGATGQAGADCDEGNCTGNFTVQQSLVQLPGYTDAQVGAFLLFLIMLLFAFFQRWLFVAIASIIGILDVVLIGGIFGFTFTGLLVVLGIVLQILVDHRDALKAEKVEREEREIGT